MKHVYIIIKKGKLLLRIWQLVLLTYCPEDGGIKDLWNIGKLMPEDSHLIQLVMNHLHTTTRESHNIIST
jgi:hypothetical protein